MQKFNELWSRLGLFGGEIVGSGQLSSHLSPNGLLMMNVYDRSDDHVLVSAIGNTLQQVFPSVFVRSSDGDNHIILAFQEPQSESWIRQTLTRAASNLALKKIAAVYNKQLVEFEAPSGTQIFTDNHAPIEQLTSQMLRE